MATADVSPVEVAVIGAGLCGLALARALHGQGLSFVLVEARERLGGRVLTRRCEATGQLLDLGPTWFWPDTEPRVAALLAELGLASVPQHDPGDALWLVDPDREPERRGWPEGAPGGHADGAAGERAGERADEPTGERAARGVHAGARRIAGGAGRLVEALAAALPAGRVLTGRALRLVRDRGAWFELQLVQGDSTSTLRARRVVLALPPRLVAERIAFDPPLPASLAGMLAATPTWMAAAARSLTTWQRPFWRAAGHSGNAFVRHAQAVLGEVFDASDAATPAGALGGFLALDAAQRKDFERGLPLLIESQLMQLYGPDAGGGRSWLLDWADETWTCSRADRAAPPAWPQADPALRGSWFGERLYFGGSETALHGAGHMEGAFESAARIARSLLPVRVQREAQDRPVTEGAALARFARAVAAWREGAPGGYRQHVVRLLSGQCSDPLTQHALLATVGQVYSEALAELDRLLPAFEAGDAAAAQVGRHRLTPALLEPFQGWSRELLDSALAFNGASCALSNFPDDHRPDAALQKAIALDLAAAWREFALEVNGRLVEAALRAGPAGAPA